jgi:hypothetical protein
MNLRWVLVLASAAIAVLAAYLLWLPHYYIAASPVMGSRATGLNGSFRITQAKVFSLASAPDQPSGYFVGGIISERFGGGCIVFRASDLGFNAMAAQQCHSNADCSKPPPDGTDPLSEEAYSYQVNPARRENRFGYCDQTTNICWSKPILAGNKLASADADKALCQRRIKYPPGQKAWDPDVDYVISVSATDLAGFGLHSAPVRARMVACLNGSWATPENGCRSVLGPERIEVLGTESPDLP